MAFCKNCGAEHPDGQKYCLECGVELDSGANKDKKRDIHIPSLVFSIINLFLCQLAGIVALVLTVMAPERSPEDEAKYLKAAKIINIVGVVLFALVIVAYILFYVFFFALYFEFINSMMGLSCLFWI